MGDRLWRRRLSGNRGGRRPIKPAAFNVNPDLSLPGHQTYSVIGDMALLKQENGDPVPGVSPAAMQMGNTSSAVQIILKDLRGDRRENFKYARQRHDGHHRPQQSYR